MKDFKNKVAVITGAASGIGRDLAEYCAQKEMKIVLADVEEKALSLTESEMKPLIQMRMDGIMEERNPVLPPMGVPNN